MKKNRCLEKLEKVKGQKMKLSVKMKKQKDKNNNKASQISKNVKGGNLAGMTRQKLE